MVYAATVGAASVDHDAYRLVVEAQPVGLSQSDAPAFMLDRLSRVTIRIQPRGNASLAAITDLRFDARMPEHNHGMLVKPVVSRLGPGSFRVDGVRLHMPGHWDITVVLRVSGRDERVVLPFEL